MSNIAMVPFGLSDWDVFSGAERAADGTEPHTNSGLVEIHVDGELVVIVVDNNGITIVDADTSELVASLALVDKIHLAIFIAQHLIADMTRAYLHGLSFDVRNIRDDEFAIAHPVI